MLCGRKIKRGYRGQRFIVVVRQATSNRLLCQTSSVPGDVKQ